MDHVIRRQIKHLEKEIHFIKDLHLMNNITTKDAKQKIKNLEKQILFLLSSLPSHEKETYLLDQEVHRL